MRCGNSSGRRRASHTIRLHSADWRGPEKFKSFSVGALPLLPCLRIVDCDHGPFTGEAAVDLQSRGQAMTDASPRVESPSRE
jgi:hypothetical protein